MPLHEMSTETLVRGNGALKIYQMARLQILQICASSCFCQKVEMQRLAATPAHCEATTVNGHAIAAPHFGCKIGRGNVQFSTLVSRTDCTDAANFFDQTREHEASVIAN